MPQQYAHINQSGTVLEIYTPLSGFQIADCISSTLLPSFIPVPTGVQVVPGWIWDGNSFSAPSLAPTGGIATAALAAKLSAQEMAGVHFTPTGSQAILFPTDANAQIKYIAEWNMIGATPPLRTDGDPMIASDGTPVALSNADAKALVEKALGYIKGCAANYAVLQPQVLADAATDVSTGWPVNT